MSMILKRHSVPFQPWVSDPRTWELAAPTIDPTSSWLLLRSTAIGWLNEEDTMSSRHLWWGPPAPTFWDHCHESIHTEKTRWNRSVLHWKQWFLQCKFPGHVVSKNGDLEWPRLSPDLTVPHFFLWGKLKSKVYASKPKTIDELKCNIWAEIAAITPEMLTNVMQNARKRAAFCVSNGSGQLIDVVF